jgi:hypothetical protein
MKRHFCHYYSDLGGEPYPALRKTDPDGDCYWADDVDAELTRLRAELAEAKRALPDADLLNLSRLVAAAVENNGSEPGGVEVIDIDELERLRSELAEANESLMILHGRIFSRRVYDAMVARIDHGQERAEKAEAELAEARKENSDLGDQLCRVIPISRKREEEIIRLRDALAEARARIAELEKA